MTNSLVGRAMTQTASRRLLTVEAHVIPCGIRGGQSDIVAGFLRVLRFPVSISFHRGSLCSCIILGGEQ